MAPVRYQQWPGGFRCGHSALARLAQVEGPGLRGREGSRRGSMSMS